MTAAASRSPSARREAFFAPSLFALLLLAVYADPLLGRRVFAGRDPLGYHYPVEKAVHDAYARGRLPVWISDISGGRPLLANPNAGALYPLRPLLSRISFPDAIRVFPVLHWLIAGLGMLALLRTLGASRSAAWVGMVAYVFSGVSVSQVFYPNIHPGMALLPWVLREVALPASAPGRRVLLLGTLFGLLILVGDAFGLLLALASSLLFVLLEVERRKRPRRLVLLAAGTALGVLLALPQIVATAAWIPETNRAVLGMRLKEVFLYSLSPWRLLELAVPFPFGSTWELDNGRIWGWPLFQFKSVGFFTSLYAGALAPIALLSTWRLPAPGARFARWLFLLSAAVCVLPSLTPAAMGELASPLPLRYPEKFAVALSLSLAVLSALALDRFRGHRAAPRWPLWVGGALALLAAGAALAPQAAGRLGTRLIGAESLLSRVASERLPGALAEAGLLWMATVIAIERLRDRPPRGAVRSRLALPLLILTAVPIAGTRRIARTFGEEEALAPTAFARAVSRADPHGSFRVLGESAYRPPSRLEGQLLASDLGQLEATRRGWTQYAGALWGRGTVFNFDFDSGDLSRLESLRRISAHAGSYRDAGAFFGGLALKWGIRYRDQDPLPGYRRFAGSAIQDWDEHERAYPDVRLVTSWREEPGALAALQALPRLTDGEIVVESGSRGAGRAREGELRIVEKSPERLIAETTAPDATWLFVLRGFWSSRRVLLDGRDVQDVPAQLAFSAVPVPAGRHRIEWRERVAGWRESRWGPIAFLAAAVALLRWRHPADRGADS